MLGKLPVWEALMKRMLWNQLGEMQNRTILDFGSGTGVTACYYARCNQVIAIEPSVQAINERYQSSPYTQLTGSTEQLLKLPDAYFDVIFCHNVLEYASDRKNIVKEFARLLKPNGTLSVVKHNRPGRVMQAAVLLNDFDKANELLNGCDSHSAQYGTIRYYEDADIEEWSDQLKIIQTLGMRTFWDLQQNQEIQKSSEWQEQMLLQEMRVSELEAYKQIAFFHHLLIQKRENPEA